MTITRTLTLLVVTPLCISSAYRAKADTFGSGANTFDVEFVDIGNPGNLPDTTGDV